MKKKGVNNMKSMAQITLEIIAKKEREIESNKIKELEGVFKKQLEECFKEKKNLLEKWNFDTDMLVIKENLDESLVKKLCNKMGLVLISDETIKGICVKVQEENEGTKTQLQLLVEEFNSEIDQEIEKGEEIVKNLCTKVFKKLKMGDFEFLAASKSQYNVSVVVSDQPLNEWHRKQIKIAMKKENFCNVSVEDTKWTFSVRL